MSASAAAAVGHDMHRFLAIVMLALLYGVAAPSRTPAVSVVALYRERMMLPASATLENPHVPVHLESAYEPSKVITQGNPSHADLLMKHVAAASPASAEGRQWTLVELHGRAVNGEHRPYLELIAGRASGSGGCNRFSGSYKLHGDAIEFAPAAATMMACIQPNVMETEGTFLKALSAVRYWKATGSELQLFDGDHKLLMRFEAQAP